MPIPIAAVAGVLLTAGFAAQAFVPPIKRHMDYFFNEAWPNRYPPAIDAVDLRRKGYIDGETYVKYMEAEGFDSHLATKIWLSQKVILGAEELLVLHWRGELSEEAYLAEMAKNGYREETAKNFLKTRLFYPSPSDLVSWQAKEVFEPDAIEKYQLDDEFELINKEAFYKAGMNDEQILNYWRAHWQHPSLTMIYELLHRGLLTAEDVYEYYRLVEIPPYWREKLTAVSYLPYTRVDTRRMYAFGVLDREGVKRSYLDQGYDEEKAENLTEFTVLEATNEDKELTRTIIEKGYTTGILSAEEAATQLIEIGYDLAETALILALKEYDIQSSIIDDKVATIKTQYRRGLVSQEQAIEKLDALNLNATYRDKVIAEIQREKTTEYQLPTKADLVRFLDLGLIDLTQFAEYLERLGYRKEDIKLYVESYKQ